MAKNSRKRLENALRFKQYDRVPIELWLPEHVIKYPKAKKLVKLVEQHADNFKGISAANWGFGGVPCKNTKKLVDEDEEYKYFLITNNTPGGEFIAKLQQSKINSSYTHYKKHFFQSEEDIIKFSKCDFPKVEFPDNYIEILNDKCGNEYMPVINIRHPFGFLTRLSPPDKFYVWLYTHKEIIHKIFKKMYNQINDFIDRVKAPFVYRFVALEMAIEPWMSKDMFDEFVYQYDVVMNEKIHKYGGLVRHHAHGNVFNHLKHWSDMGIDSLEPMELPPFGDTDLKKAKELVGDKISFGGNVPSQWFAELSAGEIKDMVIDAIDAAAKGGGFILKCASSVCGLNSYKNYKQLDHMIKSTEHFIEYGLKYGKY